MNSAITPARTRARRTPKRRPERTMEIAEARRCGGARSAAKGIRTCGVTVKVPTRKESVSKTTSEEVVARPTVSEPEMRTSRRRSGRRRVRSPRGDKSRRPVAYLCL